MFRFAHPELLYLLIVIPLLIVFYVVMIRRKKKAIAEFGNPELLGPLMPLLSFKRGTWKFVMLMLALLFVIVGVAGPQFGSKLQQVKKKGVELMIALDVSNSMMAQDIKPSRLEKAKMAISRMVEKLSNDKIGLIVFAGDAYVQLPITTDYSSAKLFLSNISTDIASIPEVIENGKNGFLIQPGMQTHADRLVHFLVFPLEFHPQITDSVGPLAVFFQQIIFNLPRTRTKRVQPFAVLISVQQERNEALHRDRFSAAVTAAQKQMAVIQFKLLVFIIPEIDQSNPCGVPSFIQHENPP